MENFCRKRAFQALQDHPMHRNVFKKLSVQDIEWSMRILEDCKEMSDAEYSLFINRIGINGVAAPAKYNVIWSLLVLCVDTQKIFKEIKLRRQQWR